MINHPQLNHSPFKIILNFMDSSDFLAVERRYHPLMKSTAYIIFLVLILSCETKDTYSSCDEILYNPKANWTVDTDSLKTIDEYLEYQKEFRINEGADKELIPQVKISDEKLISLSKIRTPLICCIRKFDYRTVMTIYVFEDKVETLWCKDTLTRSEERR